MPALCGRQRASGTGSVTDLTLAVDVLYGRNPALESLRAGRRVPRRLLLAQGVEGWAGQSEATRLASEAGGLIQRVPRAELAALTGRRQHQGVALETSGYPYAEVSCMLDAARSAGEPPFLLILDLIQDPQNAGAVMRTAEAVGVHGVLLQKRRAVGITPAVVRASSGATEHLRIAQVTNLVRSMRQLRRVGVWLYGLEERPGAIPHHQADLEGPVALVLGSEGAGLRRLVRETCDFSMAIPMRGRVESLNAAVAGSVALYTVWQKRGFQGARAAETGVTIAP